MDELEFVPDEFRHEYENRLNENLNKVKTEKETVRHVAFVKPATNLSGKSATDSDTNDKITEPGKVSRADSPDVGPYEIEPLFVRRSYKRSPVQEIMGRYLDKSVSSMSNHFATVTRTATTRESIEPSSNKRLVYVNFFTNTDKKTVSMHLDERFASEQVAQKADELFPNVQWKICSGTQESSDFEFLNSSQVWDAIKTSPICRFSYLLVRLERLQPIRTNDHNATCDECRQDIIGHRFKCLECADFDICQSCEATSAHQEHAMIRIVKKGVTKIPSYVTDNAPSFVFRNSH